MEVRELIRTSRVKHGLSQQDVADYLGVSKASISRWESGKITNIGRDKAFKLCELLNISPVDFIGKTANYRELAKADEHKLIVNYRKLNSRAKAKANSYILDLVNAGYVENL